MKKFKTSDLVKFIIFVLFIAGMITTGIVFYPKLKAEISFENIRAIIDKNQSTSILLFILLQVLQVIIFIIPGDVINATGGFCFNLFLGSLLSFVGVTIGSICAFYIARFLGYNFVSKFVKKEKLEKLSHALESNKSFIGFFIFCNLPFVPKDILMYVAGLTPMKAKRTLTIYCLSRIPGIIIWTSMGANLYNKSFLGMIITIGILILFLSFIILIKNRMDKRKIIKVK